MKRIIAIGLFIVIFGIVVYFGVIEMQRRAIVEALTNRAEKEGMDKAKVEAMKELFLKMDLQELKTLKKLTDYTAGVNDHTPQYEDMLLAVDKIYEKYKAQTIIGT
jgi:hypothetical protein